MFQVEWWDAALDELADALVASDLPTQDAIEVAVTRLNARLASDPFAFGESRTGKRRIAFEKPCAILYTADAADGKVVVIHFWTY